MKNLKKWYINLSIQRKILYCTLGVALVVLLAASVSQYMSASSIVTEQTRKQSAGVVNELSVNLDHYFDMVRNSFEYIANNNTVQEELESDKPYKSDGTELYSYYSRSGQIRRLLLQVAAILHDCGKYISFANGPSCSYDIIMASEIIGLTHKEREIIANTVLYNTWPLPDCHKAFC